ncbi:amino acid ABC transporter membrane protein 1, PAAT family [Halodesulfovibrio aestuarii]|uniref:Putative glutamine transport system permease protein GlnP n=2 Tax=Halodesulfovibrio aestuarii TaxID=126333 RepID=A0A8G2C9Y1_9BACT|nr:amino acid ABC transporter membrane protein 1, PAAT family [Halodesulfovibrio aestuarii]
MCFLFSTNGLGLFFWEQVPFTMQHFFRKFFHFIHPETRFFAVDLAMYLAVMSVFLWSIFSGAEASGYNWQWNRVPRYIFTFTDGTFHFGPLLTGLGITLEITCYSMVLAFLFGLTAVLLRYSKSIIARYIALLYVELIRNTPLMLQVLIMYFVIAPVLEMERFLSAVLVLALFEGAYIAEIFRAGIGSVPKGQWEAAESVGLSRFHIYRLVVLPQAIRATLPPLTGQAVSLVKDSALVSVIAIYDLTMQGQAIISETYLTFEIWFIVALIYLLITVSLSFVVHFLEKKYSYDF